MRKLDKAIEETASAIRGLSLMYANDHPVIKHDKQILNWLRELKKLRKTQPKWLYIAKTEASNGTFWATKKDPSSTDWSRDGLKAYKFTSRRAAEKAAAKKPFGKIEKMRGI